MKRQLNILSYLVLMGLLWGWAGNSDVRISLLVGIAVTIFLLTTDLLMLLRRPLRPSQRIPASMHFLILVLTAMTIGSAIALVGALIGDRKLYLIGMVSCIPAYFTGAAWNFFYIIAGGEHRSD